MELNTIASHPTREETEQPIMAFESKYLAAGEHQVLIDGNPFTTGTSHHS